MNKEVPLKERIEKLYESGYVNEFNYLESQLQEARYLVTILHKQTEEKDTQIEVLEEIKDYHIDLIDDMEETLKYYKSTIDTLRKDLLNYIEEWKDVDSDYFKGRCTMARDVLRKLEGDDKND